MIDPFRLLAMTFFADPSFNEKVKSGSVTSLPQVAPLAGIAGQPVLPQEYISQGLSDPGSWPLLPSFDIPPSPFSWVGSNHQYPQSPSKDPFYTPALSTYQSKKNGDVIAIRPVGLNAVFPEVKQAWQISYRTESATGNPTADVTTLLIPKKYDGKHLMSWQDWEDSNNVKCAPSYLFEAGLRDPTVDIMLLQGWALNVPDHQGINSAFAVGYKSGKSTLDSIRAVKNAASQLSFSYQDVSMYGYSGGSIATGFALELQPTYAPEIQLKAASMGGVVARLNSTLYAINKSLFAGFAFGGLYGLATEYGFIDVLDANLKPSAKKRADAVQDHCLIWDILNYIGEDIFDYLTLGANTINVPQFAEVLGKEHMGFNVPPHIPIYIHQGGSDEIAPATEVDKLVDYYCENGLNVGYERDPGVEHLIEMIVGIPNAVKFFQKVFNDGYSPKACASHQDAINNNDVRMAATDDKQAVNKAILGDYSGFGLPNVLSI